MKLNGHNLEQAHQIAPASAAAWVGKKDTLLIVREASNENYEAELIRWPGLKSIERQQIRDMATVARVGEKQILLMFAADVIAQKTKQSIEIRTLKDLSKVVAFEEDSPGFFAVHPDGSRVAIGHDSGALNVWNTQDGALIATHESSGIGGVAWSHDGALLAAKEFGGTLKIFDADTVGKKPVRTVKLGKEPAIAFHPKRLIIAAADKQAIQMVDSNTGAVTDTIKGTKESGGSFRQMVFSPDGKLLATGSRGANIVALWDVEKSKFLGKLREFDIPIAAVDFDASGKHLIVASFDEAEIYTIS